MIGVEVLAEQVSINDYLNMADTMYKGQRLTGRDFRRSYFSYFDMMKRAPELSGEMREISVQHLPRWMIWLQISLSILFFLDYSHSFTFLSHFCIYTMYT